MTNETIILSLISSLLSGILGVVLSLSFYSRLEKRRIKIDSARKMFGNRHDISGDKFQESMNEIIIVFSDSKGVIKYVYEFINVIETPETIRGITSADTALINLMKAIIADIGIKPRKIPDSYFLKFFTVPPNA